MKKSSYGFTLLSAIFLLVVIAALSLFVVIISNTQQQNSVMNMLGALGYQAAKAGLERHQYFFGVSTNFNGHSRLGNRLDRLC